MPTDADVPQRARAARSGGNGSAGHVLDLIRQAGGLTRAEILEQTGLARTTVTSRLAALQAADLVTTGGTSAAVRGRPPSQFLFREDTGALLLADAGATGVRTALTDLGGAIRHERREELDITIGPEAWLTEVSRLFAELVAEDGCEPAFVRGIGVALPGPVDFASGTVVRPPIMPGWNGFPIRTWFAQTYDCPVIVDKDANAMATGEHAEAHGEHGSMLMLKVATGIGAGLVIDGRIYRGEQGAAGDLGHIQVGPLDGRAAPLCRCGNVGCIEAYAAGWALVRDLQEQGRDVHQVADLAALVKLGDPTVVGMTREAGRTIGIALSDAVNLLNPGVVVIGGELGDVADNLVTGIREVVYARSLTLATRTLEIKTATLGRRAGLIGLARTLTDHVYDPARVNARLG